MNSRETLKFGKCCFIEASERCGCQRYRANLTEENICDICFHNIGFHEKIEEETVSSITSSLLMARKVSEEFIANELNQTFSQRNTSNSFNRSRRNNQGLLKNFDPMTTAPNNNSILNRISRNRKEVIREPWSSLIQIILLPEFGPSLPSPMVMQEK